MGIIEKIIASVLEDPATLVAVALAAFIGVVAGSAVIGIWRFVFLTIPRFIRYKCWPLVFRRYLRVRARYRQWKANRILFGHFRQGNVVKVGRRSYMDSLVGSRDSRFVQSFVRLEPAGPRWLNDYYVSNAVERLFSQKRIIKAHEFDPTKWPLNVSAYHFWLRTPTSQTAEEFETESRCIGYQKFVHCSTGPRFGEKPDTQSAWMFHDTLPLDLRESAPPCQRCWDQDPSEIFVRREGLYLAKSKLGTWPAPDITGDRGELLEAVVVAHLEAGLKFDMGTVEQVVDHAIEIRMKRLATLGGDQPTVWTDQQSADLFDELIAYIRDAQLPRADSNGATET